MFSADADRSFVYLSSSEMLSCAPQLFDRDSLAYGYIVEYTEQTYHNATKQETNHVDLPLCIKVQIHVIFGGEAAEVSEMNRPICTRTGHYDRRHHAKNSRGC